MLRSLLICGLIAGVLGGLLATGFARGVGEAAVDQAIAFEGARAAAAGEPAEPALVSRSTQKSFGLLTAAVVFGLSIGGLFALTFAAVYGRVGRASPARTALWLAAAAYVVVFLVPFIKYPSNPPAVGDPDTIGRRTGLYVCMIVISLLAAYIALRLRATYARRLTASTATLLAVATYAAIALVAGLVLPAVHEVPGDFPAATLWRFRESTVGMQAILWTTIGLVFAGLAPRVMAGKSILPRRTGPKDAESPANAGLS